MAERLYLTDSKELDVFDFSVDGYSFNGSGYSSDVDLSFIYGVFEKYITFKEIKSTVRAVNNVMPPAYNVTIELWYNQDGQSGSTGQIPLTRTTDTAYKKDLYRYENDSFNPSYKLVMPWNDSRSVTYHITFRVNGTQTKDTTFVTVCPSDFSILSLSPSTPQTGKVCTVTLPGTIARTSNFYPTTPFRVNAYHNTASGAEYAWWYWSCYINDGTTAITENTGGFSSFQFYVPYDSSKPKTDNNGKVYCTYRTNLVDLNDLYYTGYSVRKRNWVESTYSYSFTWSYVDQIDSAAGPRIDSTSVTADPSTYLATYGKYIGGGLTVLRHDWNVSHRFGSSFSKVTYALYNSDGTFVKRWEYTSVTAFLMTLTNTVNTRQYIVVTIMSSNGSSTAASYPTFESYGYANPEILSLNASRCNSDGTANDEGAYCKITYQFKVTSLDAQNQKKVTLTAPDGSHVYTNLDYDHGSAYQYISAADIEHSYVISVAVEDDFMSVSRTMNISTAGVIMDFLSDGKGIGLGKVAETTKMVEVNSEWTFKADKMTFKGQDLQTILESLGYVFPP